MQYLQATEINSPSSLASLPSHRVVWGYRAVLLISGIAFAEVIRKSLLSYGKRSSESLMISSIIVGMIFVEVLKNTSSLSKSLKKHPWKCFGAILLIPIALKLLSLSKSFPSYDYDFDRRCLKDCLPEEEGLIKGKVQSLGGFRCSDGKWHPLV